MRILYFADIRFPLERANGIQTMQTCHALAGRGHDVTLVVRPDTTSPPRDPFEHYGLSPDDRLKIVHLRVPEPAAARRAAYLAGALARGFNSGRSADVVFTRDLGVASLLLRIGRRHRAPIVYESHGFSPRVAGAMGTLLSGARSASRLKQRRLFRRERRVWHRAEGYVTITLTLADELRRTFGARNNVRTIADGVRFDGGREPEPPESGPPVVGYAGNLYPWKGVDVLLRALALMPQVRGLIVGGNPAERDLEVCRLRVSELELESRVELTGAVPSWQVGRVLERAHVLVLPNVATHVSARYTSPLKLFEYMAACRPIVASDFPSIREVVRDGENGLLVEPGQPEAFAAAIGRLIEEPALASRLARQAHDDVRDYTWDRRAERLEGVLNAAIRAHRQAARRARTA